MKKEVLLPVGVGLSLLLSGYAAVKTHLTAAAIETQMSQVVAAVGDGDRQRIGAAPSASTGKATGNPDGTGVGNRPGADASSVDGGTRVGAAGPSASSASSLTSSKPVSQMSAEEKQAMEDAIADAVDAKLREQEAEKAVREKNRERTEWGEWKAPIDDLAADLDMDANQKAAATDIFDRARDKFTELIAVKRPDGTSVLSDFAEDLKNGVPQEDALKDFQYAIQHDLVPGTETSILSELLLIKDDVTTQLGENLDRNQLTEYKKLKVDSLQVETGYDPIRDYILDYMKE